MNTERASRLLGHERLSALMNRYVAVTFLVQTLSYATLVGFFEHGDMTPLVGLTSRLPTVLAVVLGVFAIPALLVTLAIGVVIESGFGFSLQTLGIGLVSGSDIPFLAVAYLLSVAVARRVIRSRETPDSG